ncbi:hypothetical protein G7Y79_00009g025660 [Physcia stellaris]|nr:hypothetical protein G7Y79_00009g025660 [Physcia stellaris]
MFAKVSLLLFLYRIFRVDRKFRVVSWIIGAVVVIWTTVSFFLMVFTCSPINATWNHKLRLDPKTHCGKPQNVVIYQGYCNIITDFCLLILPIPLVWNLQMNMRKKLGLAFVFATGIVICIISIVRQYIIYHTNKDTDDWVATRNIVWLSIEFSLSIIIACLPALTPLLKSMSGLSNLIPSVIRSRFTLKSSQKLSGDVEHGGQEHYPNAAWQTPREWKKPGHRQSFDTRGSKESEMALQPMQPTHRELNHKD